VQPPKTARPATANGEPALNCEQLAGELVSSNTPKAAELQAPPLLADIAGESDYAFFSRRPSVTSRIRLPFENEYPPSVLEPGRSAFVRIRIERDPDGQLKRRARRRLLFCDGGTA
jgi:hypothetical protein